MKMCKRTFIRQRLHIHNRNLDALLRQQAHNNLSNSIASPRNNNNFLVPIPRIAAPIVHNSRAQPATHCIQRPQREERLEMAECGPMLRGEGRALGRVAREKDEWESEGWIEGGSFEKAKEGVVCDSW
jgi:hypothetical protein